MAEMNACSFVNLLSLVQILITAINVDIFLCICRFKAFQLNLLELPENNDP